MGKWRIWVTAISFSALLTLNAGKGATAEVQADVDISAPSPSLFSSPPQVVVIPGTYVYVVPDMDMNVLFYQGYWYCPQGKHWYRASLYNGPWERISRGQAPRALVKLPANFRRVPPGRHRISLRELQANWGEWEREKHWVNDEDWRAGLKGQKGKPR